MIEISSIDRFHSWVRNLYGSGPLPVAAVQNLDLTPFTTIVSTLNCPGSLFLGCPMAPEAAGALVQQAAIVIPDLPDRAHEVHRASLYGVEELFEAFDPERPASWHDCLDQRIYREYLADGPDHKASLLVGLLRAIHDHAMSDALWQLIEGHRVVAVMGGHGMERRDPRYASVVLISKRLAERGYLMTTGGGPGAMEAAHLGAWLAGRPDSIVGEILAGEFARRPEGATAGKEYADADWLQRAWRLRETVPRDNDISSVGIPTWLYGHEPPTCFATHHAKFFANSIREDGVLAVARHGILFAPGNAGTTQEIFQDACQNHYATVGGRSPMILFDRHYWTEQRPVWPLLHAVTHDQSYAELVTITDDEHAVVEAIEAYDPAQWTVRKT